MSKLSLITKTHIAEAEVGRVPMVVYFKSYVVLVCAIAIALPVVYSTVYPMMTGQLVASSLGGLITMFVLFALGMLLGFGIFERKAQAKADSWVSLYNDGCDPLAFLRDGRVLADAMRAPYNQVSSWYIGYYAQAQLDSGDTQDAKDALDALLDSIDTAKRPLEKIGIIVNTVPLMEKLSGPGSTLSLINDGLELCSQAKGSAAAQYRDFLESQLSIMRAMTEGDFSRLAKLDEAVWTSSRYPRRIRAEYAWDGAAADYKAGDVQGERRALQYVANNGGSLAITGKARERLRSVG